MQKNARLVAERYARALSAATPDEGGFSRITADLTAMARLFEDCPDFRRALASPTIAVAEKQGILRAVVERSGIGSTTLRFLEVLATNRRISILPGIAAAAAAVLDERQNTVEVEVRAIAPLGAALRARLTAALEKSVGAKVRLKEKEDPSVLGGLVVRYKGVVVDGSLATRLELMKARLAGGMAGAVTS